MAVKRRRLCSRRPCPKCSPLIPGCMSWESSYTFPIFKITLLMFTTASLYRSVNMHLNLFVWWEVSLIWALWSIWVLVHPRNFSLIDTPLRWPPGKTRELVKFNCLSWTVEGGREDSSDLLPKRKITELIVVHSSLTFPCTVDIESMFYGMKNESSIDTIIRVLQLCSVLILIACITVISFFS